MMSRIQRFHDRRRGPRVEHELGTPGPSVDHKEAATSEDIENSVIDLHQPKSRKSGAGLGGGTAIPNDGNRSQAQLDAFTKPYLDMWNLGYEVDLAPANVPFPLQPSRIGRGDIGVGVRNVNVHLARIVGWDGGNVNDGASEKVGAENAGDAGTRDEVIDAHLQQQGRGEVEIERVRV